MPPLDVITRVAVRPAVPAPFPAPPVVLQAGEFLDPVVDGLTGGRGVTGATVPGRHDATEVQQLGGDVLHVGPVGTPQRLG